MSIKTGLEYVGYIDPWTDEERLSDEEIVRCMDCESATDHCEGMNIYWCEYLSRYVGAYTFCAWGVRREDA